MNESQREAHLDGSGGGKKLGRVEEEDTIFRIYYVKKTIIFSYKKKKMLLYKYLNIGFILRKIGS